MLELISFCFCILCFHFVLHFTGTPLSHGYIYLVLDVYNILLYVNSECTNSLIFFLLSVNISRPADSFLKR